MYIIVPASLVLNGCILLSLNCNIVSASSFLVCVDIVQGIMIAKHYLTQLYTHMSSFASFLFFETGFLWVALVVLNSQDLLAFLSWALRWKVAAIIIIVVIVIIIFTNEIQQPYCNVAILDHSHVHTLVNGPCFQPVTGGLNSCSVHLLKKSHIATKTFINSH